MIESVIFDMDGTLLDTESVLIDCWMQSANFYGFPMERKHALTIRSLRYDLAERYLKQTFGADFNYAAIREKRKQLVIERLERDGIPVKKGAFALLQFCKEHHIQTVVATASNEKSATHHLSQTGLLPYFTAIVGGDQIAVGKPSPCIYEQALLRVNASAKHSFAVEDSPNGILSAFYAGCKVIMIPDQSEPDELLKPLLHSVQPDLEALIPILEKEM